MLFVFRRCPLFVLACLLFSGLPSRPVTTLAQGPPQVSVVDVDLPSESTGSASGTLAVRVILPDAQAGPRYAEGAPVIIFAQGGDSTGGLTPELLRAEQAVRIVFLHPGGRDAPTGRSSDGVYDNRGPNCIAALRDVILFAAGRLRDDRGRTIDDVVPVPVLHGNIGLFGSSNGGNIVIAVVAEYGAELRGLLRYVIQWESPVSSQVATVEMGPTRTTCPGGGRGTIASLNPWYHANGYSATEMEIDYSRLRYDPANTNTPVFFDSNGDGLYTTRADGSGCQTPDMDGNGTISTTEDFPLSSYVSGDRRAYSRAATHAMMEHNVFAEWPASILTVEEADAYWDSREAVRLYDEAAAAIPELEGMVLCSLVDHVQSVTIDKPHTHQAFDGWRAAGLRVQINASRAAVLDVDPTLSSRDDLPDNQPNTAPVDWNDPESYAYPDQLEQVCQAAAVYEMADRARAAGGSDTSAPDVTVATPNGGERVRRGATLRIEWTASDDTGIVSQDVQLSTDGGRTFTITIASALDGPVRSLDWSVPDSTPKGKQNRIRVVARDAAGNEGGDASDGNFRIRKTGGA